MSGKFDVKAQNKRIAAFLEEQTRRFGSQKAVLDLVQHGVLRIGKKARQQRCEAPARGGKPCQGLALESGRCHVHGGKGNLAPEKSLSVLLKELASAAAQEP